jgi:antitoxin HicB
MICLTYHDLVFSRASRAPWNETVARDRSRLDLHLAAAGSIAGSRSRTGSIQRSVGCRISSVEPRRLVGTIPAAARVMLRALHAEDGGGYLAVVPDLPGCMSDGDTPAEAVQNVTAAIDEWIAEAMRLNRAVPTPTRRQVAY